MDGRVAVDACGAEAIVRGDDDGIARCQSVLDDDVDRRMGGRVLSDRRARSSMCLFYYEDALASSISSHSSAGGGFATSYSSSSLVVDMVQAKHSQTSVERALTVWRVGTNKAQIARVTITTGTTDGSPEAALRATTIALRCASLSTVPVRELATTPGKLNAPTSAPCMPIPKASTPPMARIRSRLFP
jgi:hypothetical protein